MRAPRVAPLVDQLFKDARVGVLRDEAQAEHFQPLACDFLHDGGVVEEPPAAEEHQVGEFAGQDAEFMLVFATEDADEKTVVRMVAADVSSAFKSARPFASPASRSAGLICRRTRS